MVGLTFDRLGCRGRTAGCWDRWGLQPFQSDRVVHGAKVVQGNYIKYRFGLFVILHGEEAERSLHRNGADSTNKASPNYEQRVEKDNMQDIQLKHGVRHVTYEIDDPGQRPGVTLRRVLGQRHRCRCTQ